MTIYTVYIDDSAQKRLETIASELGQTVEDLIESSAEEAALNHFRNRSDDPAEKQKGMNQ